MEWISGVSAVLTSLVVLAALRGQRVTNSNEARSRHAAALTQARLVVIDQGEPSPEGATQLVLTNLGDAPVLDVRLSAFVSVPDGALLGGDALSAPGFATLGGKQNLVLPQYPVEVSTVKFPAVLTWYFTWTDIGGYEWSNSFVYDDIKPGRTGRPEMRVRPSGSGPIGSNTSRWQRFRNFVAPYDYWPVRGQSVDAP